VTFFWKRKRRLVLPFVILVSVVSIIVGVDFKINGRKAQLIMADLEKEIGLIQPPPGAVVMGHDARSKPRQALVSRDYSADSSYQSLRAHYDAELSRLGWKFQREDHLKEWEVDRGGMAALYCKESYTASLYYAGEHPQGRRDYTISLSWGLHSCQQAAFIEGSERGNTVWAGSIVPTL